MLEEINIEEQEPDRNYYPGCGDNSCLVFKPKGMGTNGGCCCHTDPGKARKAISILWNRLQNLKHKLNEKPNN